MVTRPDYYKILHVAPDAPEEIIRASYRTLMQALRMHPDLGGDHERATLINEAFRTLGDPDNRARYDERLRRDTGTATDDAPTGTKIVIDEGAAVAQAKESAERALCPFCRGAHEVGQRDTPDAMCTACGAPLYSVSYHQTDGDARRAVDRLPRNARISFRTAGDSQTVRRGVSRDVSLNGMRFLAESSLDMGERVIIACEYCIAAAIVRNVRRCEADAAGWECGVEFLTLRIRRQRGSLISTVA
jgi:curved DNA-binding protein CbpA